MSNFTPLPESEQERRIKKVIDKIEDMYNDEDYRKYVWGFIVSADGGKTFDEIDGYKPPGTVWAIKQASDIAPISGIHTIEPTALKISAITASGWTPDHHPLSLLRGPIEGDGSPDIYWQAPNDDKGDHSITLDLGAPRVIGAVAISALKAGTYHFQINTGLNPADFVVRARNQTDTLLMNTRVTIALPRLVKDRFVQIVTDCKEITRVQVFSMFPGATQEEKERLSKDFYEDEARAKRHRPMAH